MIASLARLRGVAAGTAAAIVALLAISVGTRSASDSARTIVIDRTSAAQAVGRLVPASELTGLLVSAPVDGAVDTYYSVTTDRDRASVDVHDGRVTMLIRNNQIPKTVHVALSNAAAEGAATQWLQDRAIPIDGMAVTSELVDHGDSKAYKVSFQRLVDGVIVPDARTVYLDPATGDVFLLSDLRRQFDPPPVAKLDRGQAQTAAIVASGLRSAEADSAQLMITFKSDGSQQLVWEVDVRAPIKGVPAADPIFEHALVRVGALDGSTDVIGQG